LLKRKQNKKDESSVSQRAASNAQSLTPAQATIRWMAKLLSAIPPEWIGLESQCKHPWMRKAAWNPMHFTQKHLYIWNCWEKSIFVNLPYWFLAIFRENEKIRFPHSF